MSDTNKKKKKKTDNEFNSGSSGNLPSSRFFCFFVKEK